jgi:SAM-dependent methyltransferase
MVDAQPDTHADRHADSVAPSAVALSNMTPSASEAWSYTGGKASLADRLREARNLYRVHAEQADRRVAQVVALLTDVEGALRDRYGFDLNGKRVLDIGSGQQLMQLTYFAARNEVAGIDLDMIVSGFQPLAYVRMWRVNGAARTVKTLARKAMRLDARYAKSLRERVGRGPRGLQVERMDVAAMTFADGAFDFAYCNSVFHHLPDPGRALDEMARVLAPGGVGYLTLQLWTSETGSLDPRLFAGQRDDIPFWAHLRPAEEHKVTGNAFLNKHRLAAWQVIFAAHWPGCRVELSQPRRDELEPVARRLQADGDLAGYSLDELVTHELRVSWQKP